MNVGKGNSTSPLCNLYEEYQQEQSENQRDYCGDKLHELESKISELFYEKEGEIRLNLEIP